MEFNIKDIQRELTEKDKVSEFLGTIFDGIGADEQIRVFQCNKDNTYKKVSFFNNIESIVDFTTNKYSKWNNTYFQLTTTNGDGGADNRKYAYVLALDFDKKDLGFDTEPKDILLKFKEIGLWYHAIIDSGNGYHTYTMIDRTDNLEMYDEVVKTIGALLGADTKATLSTQILRIPYTLNVKGDKPKTVRIIKMYDKATIKRYRLSDLYNRFCNTTYRDNDNKNITYTLKGDVPICVGNALKNGSKVGCRNKELYNIVVYLKNKGENISHIKYVCDEWNTKNEELYTELDTKLTYIYNNCSGYMCSECDTDIKVECKQYTMSNFDLEQYGENIIDIHSKVGRQCRDSKRKGVISMNGNELFIYNVLVNNKDILLDKDGIMNLITDRKTKKVALTEKYVREALKGLADKEYVTIIKGTKRLGIADTYMINRKKINEDNMIKVTYFINIMVIKGHITTTELRCYMRMRYLHNEEVKKGRAKGNIFTITMEELAKDLGTDKAHVSRYIKNLYENMILDRRAIPMKDNPKQFYYEYKLNM